MMLLQSPADDPSVPKSFPCSFPECNAVFDKQTLLKRHLRDIRGCGFDTVHYQGHPEWQKLDDMQFLHKHTRPKGMPNTERVQRRALTNKRHYDAHKEEIRVKSKQRREKINDTLQVTKSLGTVTQSLLSVGDTPRHLLLDLYGSSDPLQFDKFVNVDGPVDMSTFPRIVLYHLPQHLTPNVHGAVPGETRILDAVPGATHYRKTSNLLHPDKNGPAKAQSLLNAAYDLWRPILEDPELADVKVHSTDEAAVNAFIRNGASYQALSQMYFSTYIAMGQVIKLLLPSNLSVESLRLLVEAEEERKRLAEEEDVDHLIMKALEAPAVENMSRGGGVGAKRRRGDVDGNAETPRTQHKSSSDDTSESPPSVSSGSASPPTEDTIDPQLFRL